MRGLLNSPITDGMGEIMQIKRLILVTFICVWIAACGRPEDAESQCENLGYLSGTVQFDQCYQATMERFQRANLALVNMDLQMMSQP